MKKLIMIFFCMFAGVVGHAQDINTILRSIDENNLRLKVARQQNAATLAEQCAENALGETSVEYSPFYQGGVTGVASSELIVSQEFDFPTLYGARRKTATLQSAVLDNEYQLQRREIMLQAAQACYDFHAACQTAVVLNERLAATDSLLTICELRIKHGDATIIDLNRIRFDRMNMLKEKVSNEAEREALAQSLNALSPGLFLTKDSPITCSPVDMSFVAWAEVGEASLALANHKVNIARQGWLPKITAGYRRNTEVHEAQNGFLVGMAMPLFSNGGKVKAARLRREAAEQDRERLTTEYQNRRRSLQSEQMMLRQLLSTFDEELMNQTLVTLMYAVKAGELSVIDYYTEAERIYSVKQERIEIENRLNKVILEL